MDSQNRSIKNERTGQPLRCPVWCRHDRPTPKITILARTVNKFTPLESEKGPLQTLRKLVILQLIRPQEGHKLEVCDFEIVKKTFVFTLYSSHRLMNSSDEKTVKDNSALLNCGLCAVIPGGVKCHISLYRQQKWCFPGGAWRLPIWFFDQNCWGATPGVLIALPRSARYWKAVRFHISCRLLRLQIYVNLENIVSWASYIVSSDS